MIIINNYLVINTFASKSMHNFKKNEFNFLHSFSFISVSKINY